MVSYEYHFLRILFKSEDPFCANNFSGRIQMDEDNYYGVGVDSGNDYVRHNT